MFDTSADGGHTRTDGHDGHSESDRLLDRLEREVAGERHRLARLSERITGTVTRPKAPIEPLSDRLDRLIGLGSVAGGRLLRLLLLFREESERDEAQAVVVIDFQTGQRTVVRSSLDELHARVHARLTSGDVIPGILFRERPGLARFKGLVAATALQEKRRAEARARRRLRRAAGA